MARPRSLPDADVFAALLHILTNRGEHAVGFAAIAQATGLAAPTLVQRYGNRDGMIRAALMAMWDRLDAALAVADAAADSGPALLKALTTAAPPAAALALGLRDAALRDRATAWRQAVETALARHSGHGNKARESAAMLFAAWQGDLIWRDTGGKGFRLKDAAKRLG